MISKLSDISFVSFVNKYDFVCLTETFAGSGFDYSSIFPDFTKFISYAKKISHQGRYSGGVLVLVKNNLSKYVKEIKTDCDNVVILQIDKSLFNLNEDVLFVSCYVNPQGSPAYNDTHTDNGIVMLEEELLQLRVRDEVNIIVCGDLNARTGREQAGDEEMEVDARGDNEDREQDRCSKDSTINTFGKSLLDFCFLFNLYIVNGFCSSDKDGEFTFVAFQGCSVIDYFLVSRKLYLNCHLCVLNEVFSWHLPVQMVLETANITHACEQDECEDNLTDTRVVWSEECGKLYKEQLEKPVVLNALNDATRLLSSNLDASVSIFENALFGAAACMVRSVGRKKKFSDWFDRECCIQKRLTKAALQRYRRAKETESKMTKKDIYIQERKKYCRMIKKKKKEFDEKRLMELKGAMKDSKSFWQTIKRVNRNVVIHNGIKNQQWYDHFFKVFNVDEKNSGNIEAEEDILETDLVPHNSLFSDPITVEEVIASIKRLKNGKSAGPDKIISEMLKDANRRVIDYLVTLFNTLFESGTFPIQWSKSIIVPIFKKGDTNNPDNYRGVALTSIVSKVYTGILNRRLVQWAELEKKIVEEQAGFRANYSTIDHIFTLYSLVEKFLSRHSKLYVAFIDFRKAFDSVDRDLLWYVMRKVGVHGKLYRALRGIYNTVTACVRDKGNYSKYFPCPKGVKQGCLLSPQMFCFFINELATEVSKSGRHGIQIVPGAIEIFMLLFADDIILMSSSVVGLQNQLTVLKKEADKLLLSINMEKTNIIVFRMGGYLSIKEKWWYGTVEVRTTNAYRYLGMIFTTKLSLSSFLEDTCRKAKKGVIQLLRCMNRLKSTDCCIFWKLFEAQIEPILSYAAEVWGLEDNVQLERIHTFAIKRSINVPLHSSNSVIYGETGRYPLYICTYVKCIKYWLRLIKLENNRICKQAYNMLVHQEELGYRNWAYKVKTALITNGFGIVWLSQGVGDDRSFLATFKDRLLCCFKQNWHSKMQGDSKYSWFFSFKDAFQPEKYLLLIANKWHKSMLARFRTRTLGLGAYKRWYQVDSVNQTCVSCKDQSVIESEEHFIFYCKAYTDLRSKSAFFNLNIAKRCDVTCLLTSIDEQVIKLLAKYIAEAFNVRKRILENSQRQNVC